jgi:hypothetical protein
MTGNASRLLAPALLGASLFAAVGAMAQDAGPVPGSALQGQPQAQTEEPVPEIDMTKEWPCVQGRVETLSVTQVWDGPSIDGVKGWYKEKGISDLIELLATRRVPIEETEAAIKKFAEGLPEGERDQKLTLLFAGLFDKVSSQRRSIMSGILKFQKSQQQRALELERQSTEIAKLESKREPGIVEDTPELAQAREKFNWATRIFQERQQSVPLACELPVLVEERLFGVARAIRAQMKS